MQDMCIVPSFTFPQTSTLPAPAPRSPPAPRQLRLVSSRSPCSSITPSQRSPHPCSLTTVTTKTSTTASSPSTPSPLPSHSPASPAPPASSRARARLAQQLRRHLSLPHRRRRDTDTVAAPKPNRLAQLATRSTAALCRWSSDRDQAQASNPPRGDGSRRSLGDVVVEMGKKCKDTIGKLLADGIRRDSAWAESVQRLTDEPQETPNRGDSEDEGEVREEEERVGPQSESAWPQNRRNGWDFGPRSWGVSAECREHEADRSPFSSPAEMQAPRDILTLEEYRQQLRQQQNQQQQQQQQQQNQQQLEWLAQRGPQTPPPTVYHQVDFILYPPEMDVRGLRQYSCDMRDHHAVLRAAAEGRIEPRFSRCVGNDADRDACEQASDEWLRRSAREGGNGRAWYGPQSRAAPGQMPACSRQIERADSMGEHLAKHAELYGRRCSVWAFMGLSPES